jgi:hypothetical protein
MQQAMVAVVHKQQWWEACEAPAFHKVAAARGSSKHIGRGGGGSSPRAGRVGGGGGGGGCGTARALGERPGGRLGAPLDGGGALGGA